MGTLSNFPNRNPAFLAWLEKQPPRVRALAQEFPPGTKIDVNGVAHWVISYQETSLGVSLVNPYVDYDGALENLLRLPLEAVRAAIRKQ